MARAEQRAGALGRLVQEIPDTDRRRQGARELHLPQDLLPDRQEMVGAIAVHSQGKGPVVDEVTTRNDGQGGLSDAPFAVQEGMLSTLSNDVGDLRQVLGSPGKRLAVRDGRCRADGLYSSLDERHSSC